jgi:hypothetical protein
MLDKRMFIMYYMNVIRKASQNFESYLFSKNIQFPSNL